MIPRAPLAAALVAALLLAGCDKPAEDAEAGTPRPVLTMTVAPTDPQRLGYSGTVEPRFETSLGFRMLGRIVSRSVDVGQRVEEGQELAAIDAETLNADLRSARAQLANARIQARTARASQKRTQALFEEKTVSQAELDNAEQTLSTAEADLATAQARLAKAENALSYAVLTAPFAGVITQRSADVGQVVSAGQTVMTLARTDRREAVVDIPAAQARTLSAGSPFEVVLQIAPDLTVAGKVREIAPQADPLTRTNRVRILLSDPPDAFRIGALITAIPKASADKPAVLIPETALLEKDGKTLVWTVDPKALTVATHPVQVHRDSAGRVVLDGGVAEGAILVTAGVHSLSEGRKVSLMKGSKP